MTGQPFRKDRVVAPRWRPSTRVAATGELAIVAKRENATDLSEELKQKLEAWRKRIDLVAAAELVEAAIVDGKIFEAEKAATTVLREGSNATPLVKRQASLLLERLHPAQTIQGVDIRVVRQHVHEFGHDPFSWADLALAYITKGKARAARRAMTVALQLAPMDRHILRSAARMHLHLNDAEHAHDIIVRSEAAKVDPWLAAGEIALASIAGRTPRLIKRGVQMLESGDFQPFHISELASAIGTIHLRDGNRKARRLFTRSLINPTGNSLAQAEWANPHLGGEIVSSQQIERVPDSGEARAFHAYWRGDLDAVLAICDAWIEEEPFASRPYHVATSTAIMLGRSELACKLSERGLELEPGSPQLNNHYAYALIELGEYVRASKILHEALKGDLTDFVKSYLVATVGMLSIRTGQVEEGIQTYKSVIEGFKKHNVKGAEALAASFLALEASRAEHASAAEFIGQAKELSKDLRYSPECEVVIARAEKWMAAVAHRRVANQGEATK